MSLVSGRFLGQVVPSSNRTVERTTEFLLADIPDVSACYARIPYKPDGSGQPAGGYNIASFESALGMLADAGVEAISWNGTKGALDGFTVDRTLCEHMTEFCGLPVTTVSLDALTALSRLGARRIGVVSQRPTDQAWVIGRQFTAQGVETVAVRGLSVRSNAEAANVTPEELRVAVRGCASDGSLDAVLIWGTNMPGLPVVVELEKELGITVMDSCSLGLWGCLAALRIAAGPLSGSGRIFSVLG